MSDEAARLRKERILSRSADRMKSMQSAYTPPSAPLEEDTQAAEKLAKLAAQFARDKKAADVALDEAMNEFVVEEETDVGRGNASKDQAEETSFGAKARADEERFSEGVDAEESAQLSVSMEQAGNATEEAAARRRERLLAKANTRMGVVTGEIKTPKREVEDADKSVVEDNTAKEDVPRWQRKWESDSNTISEKRALSEEVLKNLEITEKMAVEAPKAAAAAKETPVIVLRKSKAFVPKNLDGLLTTIVCAGLGYLSAITNGSFIRDHLYLPLGTFLLFAFLVRLISAASLKRLKLQPPTRASGGGELFSLATLAKFLPPAVSSAFTSIARYARFAKDANDDMMVFIFAHGLTTILMAAMATSSKQ